MEELKKIIKNLSLDSELTPEDTKSYCTSK